MRRINVKYLKPGHVVAEPVNNSSGAVLCPMGYVLTEQAIARLQSANVGTIFIEGNPDAGPDVDKLEAQLEKRFAGVTEPTLLRIKGLIQKRFDDLRGEFGG